MKKKNDIKLKKTMLNFRKKWILLFTVVNNRNEQFLDLAAEDTWDEDPDVMWKGAIISDWGALLSVQTSSIFNRDFYAQNILQQFAFKK